MIKWRRRTCAGFGVSGAEVFLTHALLLAAKFCMFCSLFIVMWEGSSVKSFHCFGKIGRRCMRILKETNERTACGGLRFTTVAYLLCFVFLSFLIPFDFDRASIHAAGFHAIAGFVCAWQSAWELPSSTTRVISGDPPPGVLGMTADVAREHACELSVCVTNPKPQIPSASRINSCRRRARGQTPHALPIACRPHLKRSLLLATALVRRPPATKGVDPSSRASWLSPSHAQRLQCPLYFRAYREGPLPDRLSSRLWYLPVHSTPPPVK
jgi:hypothetical protein